MNSTQLQPVAQNGFLPAARIAGDRRPQYTPYRGGGNQTFAGRAYGTPGFLGAVRLGQTAQTWYNRARAARERFQTLKGQIATIDNKVARDTIIAWLGGPGIEGTPEWRYAGVTFNFTTSVAQEGIQAYDKSDRQGRVEQLESFNDELSQKIESARVTYGSRSVPTVPGVTPPAPTMDLTLPILGVGALIAVAVFFG